MTTANELVRKIDIEFKIYARHLELLENPYGKELAENPSLDKSKERYLFLI